MRVRRLGASLAAALSVSWQGLPDGARAQAESGQGWILEHFADDVTVLRTNLASPPSPTQAGLLLSCEGPHRRFRVTFPETADAPLGSVRDGRVLVRAAGSRGPAQDPAERIVARFARPNAATLVIDGQGGGSSAEPVMAITQILARQPGGLDFLIHTGNGLITLPGLLAYHLPLSTGRQDAVAFRDFIDTCSRKRPEGIEPNRPGRRP